MLGGINGLKYWAWFKITSHILAVLRLFIKFKNWQTEVFLTTVVSRKVFISGYVAGISGEKVEINPLPAKGAAKLLSRQQKPATLYMDTIAACEIICKKYSKYRV